MKTLHLPPEMLSMIVRQTSSKDTSHLYKLCLCSRFLQIEAERVLYRNVIIAHHSSTSIAKLRCTTTCYRLAGYVHRLDLRCLGLTGLYTGGDVDEQLLADIRTAFPYMQRLKALSLPTQIITSLYLIPPPNCPFQLRYLKFSEPRPHGTFRADIITFMQAQLAIENLSAQFSGPLDPFPASFFPHLTTLKTETKAAACLLRGRSVKRLCITDYEADTSSEGQETLQVLSINFARLNAYLSCFAILRYLQTETGFVSAILTLETQTVF